MKIALRSLFFILILGIIGTGCQYYNSSNKTSFQMETQVNLQEPKTILIHGTLLPGTVNLTRTFDFYAGFNPASKQPDRFIHGKIPHILNKVDPEQFPLEKFYFYGWSGKLDFDERKKAAEDLYQKISHCKEPITIIAHSHGCNVALNLAEVAKEHGNKDFKVDRLILLAGPVQEATAHCVKSDIFKKIYLFYSAADIIQIIDPQGIYKNSKADNDKKVPLFSKRTFESCKNLIQTKILIYNQPPSHIDFLRERFMKWLPFIIKLVDQAAIKFNAENKEKYFTINIASLGKKPYLIEQKTIKYIPRSR